MIEDVTFETIMDRMLDRIDDSFDKRPSSPIYVALAPAALEIANIYAELEDMCVGRRIEGEANSGLFFRPLSS